MPIYEYRCVKCGKRESKFWRSLSAVDDSTLLCGKCGNKNMSRLVSRVRVLRGGAESASAGENGDVDESLMREMEGLDENNPRALGRFMRKMAAETGEELGPEFNEVVGRLEKGEDPDKIERDMGDLFGSGEGMGDEMGSTPAPAESDAPEAAPKSNRRARSAKSPSASNSKPSMTKKRVKASTKSKSK